MTFTPSTRRQLDDLRTGMRPPTNGAKFLDPKVRNSHEIPRLLVHLGSRTRAHAGGSVSIRGSYGKTQNIPSRRASTAARTPTVNLPKWERPTPARREPTRETRRLRSRRWLRAEPGHPDGVPCADYGSPKKQGRFGGRDPRAAGTSARDLPGCAGEAGL